MKYYIGADLGTSALKLLLTDSEGRICASVSKEYSVHYPRSGWSEQAPEDWWAALVDGTRELVAGIDPKEVAGLGVGGQMHGLVMLNENDEVLRPAILWNDGRTDKETAFLNENAAALGRRTANMAFAGFTAPKILWVRENEPENFAAAVKIMLPKDYLNYRLTGVHATDFSDASGMLLLDVEHRCWSEEMLEICSLRKEQLPRLYESGENIGSLRPEVAAQLGLPLEICVIAGAGDNAASAMGVGAFKEGMCNISLGTSGTLFIPTDRFLPLENRAIHNFCHANGKYHLMACMLSAASCNLWFCKDVLGTADYAAEQEKIPEEKLGENTVFFLPYLMGERSPINNTDASACFVGLRADTKREDMMQAVLEGVAFALRDNLEEIRAAGLQVSESLLTGGGARSPLWRRIIAAVLQLPLLLPVAEEGPAMGAALMANCAVSGKGMEDFTYLLRGRVEPDPVLVEKYEKRYRQYREIYPALREIYANLK
ncbi:MAG: xylulokinase [Clostridia bacterium]|nr:xylulokinase [Clostridia bacterium]